MHRRQLLAGSAVSLSLLSGCLQRTAQRSKELVEKNANRSPVTVSVAPKGTLEFRPGTKHPVRIELGRAVKFVWETDGHNIVVTSQPESADWGGHESVEDAGFTTQHTFEIEGVYEFACEPHEAAGATGTIVVGNGSLTPSGTVVQRSTVRVRIAPGNRFGFVPGSDEPLVITRGTTVIFEWKSDGHNVVVESQPNGAHWGGHEQMEETGYTHRHAFEVVGTYRFFCAPHESLYPHAIIRVVER